MKFPLLTDEQITKFLRQIRYNRIFRRRETRIPIWSLLQLIGISRQTAYRIMHRRYEHALYPETRGKLSLGADLVARGLRFTRRGRHWVPVMPTSLEVKWPELYSGYAPEDPDSAHQNLGVSQQALPKSVRRRGRSPALSEMPGYPGEMDPEALRDFEKRVRGRRLLKGVSKRFPYVQFSNPKHWRKQRLAAIRALNVRHRAMGGTGKPRLVGKTAD